MDEPKVDELKRLLRRLEKIESLTDLEKPSGDQALARSDKAGSAEALASLRKPIPPSGESLFHAPLPKLPEPDDLRLAPAGVPAAAPMPRPQPISHSAPEKGRSRTVALFFLLLAVVVGGVTALLMTGQLETAPRMAARTPSLPSPAQPGPTTVETPAPPGTAAVNVSVAVAPPPPAEAAPQPAAPAPATSSAPPVAEAPQPAPAQTAQAEVAAPRDTWAASPIATPIAGLDAASDVVTPPSSPFARDALALLTEPPVLVETKPLVVPVPVLAVQPHAVVAVAPSAPIAAAPVAQPVAPAVEPSPAPQGPRLVADSTWAIPPGTSVALPVRIEPESSAAEHYVLITGLEPDSFVSRAVEVIGGTWMIKGVDLAGAQLERAPDPPKTVQVDVQLRANSGEIVSRTPLTVVTTPAAGDATQSR